MGKGVQEERSVKWAGYKSNSNAEFQRKWHKSFYTKRIVFVQEPDNIWFSYGITSFPISLFCPLPLYAPYYDYCKFGNKTQIIE